MLCRFRKTVVISLTLIVFCGCHRIDHVARQVSALDERSDVAASGGEDAVASVPDDNSMDNGSSKDVGKHEVGSSSSSSQKNAQTNETGESAEGGLPDSVSSDSVSVPGSVKAASAEAELDEQSNNKASDATYSTSSARLSLIHI